MRNKINYKSVYRILQNRYPSIAGEITQDPVETDLREIKNLLKLYTELKGYSLSDVYKNREQSRMVFVALIIRIYDPLFYVDEEKRLKHGLRPELTRQLRCHETWISHLLQTVRTYMRAYPAFRKEVDYLYSRVIDHYYGENTF